MKYYSVDSLCLSLSECFNLFLTKQGFQFTRTRTKSGYHFSILLDDIGLEEIQWWLESHMLCTDD